MEQIYVLWDELDRFPADQTDKALAHLARKLSLLLHADDVIWLGTVRMLRGAAARKDKLKGWRIRARYGFLPLPQKYLERIAWWFRRDNKMGSDSLVGQATLTMVAEMGVKKFQAHRMRDGWIPFSEFRSSEHYRFHYTELGITDRMWLSVPYSAELESMFLIDRRGTVPHFSKADLELASTILRGIPGFHRRLFLNYGLRIAENPISPAARQILQRLLTGMSEKEIASAIGQTFPTTHKYIKAIYERFGVNSRAELMSLWLVA